MAPGDEDYHRKKHSALGKSPLDFFMEQADRIEYIGDPAVADALFLLRAPRKVRFNAILQVNNVIYETDYSLAGSTVEIRYEREWIGRPKAEFSPGNFPNRHFHNLLFQGCERG